MLINCAVYQAGKKLGEIPVSQIPDCLTLPNAFVWVALKDPDENELNEFQKIFGLHELAVEDARKGNQRPKLEEYGDTVFAVVHPVELGPEKCLVTGEVDIFVGKNYVLTIRHKSTQGFASVRSRCEKEPRHLKKGVGFVLYAVLDVIVDRYVPVMDQLEEELERIEEQIFSKVSSPRTNIEELYAFKQKLMVLQHAIGPVLEVISKLFGGRVPPICIGLDEYFRDIYDHATRLMKSIDSCREMTTTAIQVNLSFIALSESEVSKKLAGYAALFGVPTAIAGIYGMNFKHMPELESLWGYPLVLITIVILDLALWVRFRRAGWI